MFIFSRKCSIVFHILPVYYKQGSWIKTGFKLPSQLQYIPAHGENKKVNISGSCWSNGKEIQSFFPLVILWKKNFYTVKKIQSPLAVMSSMTVSYTLLKIKNLSIPIIILPVKTSYQFFILQKCLSQKYNSSINVGRKKQRFGVSINKCNEKISPFWINKF